MARSSGQLRHWDLGIRQCGTCDYDGVVEILYDPEVREAYWECPTCEAAGADKEHTEMT